MYIYLQVGVGGVCVGGWGHRLQEKGLVEDSQLGNRSLFGFFFMRKTNQHFLPYLHLFQAREPPNPPGAHLQSLRSSDPEASASSWFLELPVL